MVNEDGKPRPFAGAVAPQASSLLVSSRQWPECDVEEVLYVYLLFFHVGGRPMDVDKALFGKSVSVGTRLAQPRPEQ